MSEVIIPPGASVRLSVVVPSPGINLVCTRCNRVFGGGSAGISVEINGKQYILMTPFVPGCCGICRQVVMVFRSNADAWKEIGRLVLQIRKDDLSFLFPVPFESACIPKDSNDWHGVHGSS